MSADAFVIRVLEAADAPAYLPLRLRALREHPSAFADNAEEVAALPLQTLAERMAPGPGHCIVGAFDGDQQLCGMAGVHREPLAKLAHKAWLWGVYLAPEVRGGRLARLLLEQALALAGEFGVRQVVLGVNAANAVARALYERLGFVPFGLERGFLRHDGVLHDEVHMACVLAERWTLRRAVAADAAAVAACVRDAYARWVPVIGREPAPMGVDHAAVIARGTSFVAEVRGGVAGVLVLDGGAGDFSIENVAVAPAAAGRGLGAALLRLAEHEARRVGAGAVQLYTHEKMEANLALYHRLGYVETARRIDQGYPRVFMRKALTSSR